MKMFSLLTAAALFSSIAVVNAAEPVTLTDTQLDGVVAGDASATVSVTDLSASGPTTATVSITGSATVTTTGGLSPSNTALATLTINASSD